MVQHARRLGIVGLLLLALAACTAPTPYRQAESEDDFGYTQTRLDNQTWQLTFHGNALTTREQVERSLLYRAAEIAQSEQADGFVVLSEAVERDLRYEGTGYQPYRYGGAFGFGSGLHVGRGYHGLRQRGPFLHYGFAQPFGLTYLRPVSEYNASAKIRLFSGDAPEGSGTAYNAAEVLETVGPQITRPDPETDSN